ncbi:MULTISPECIES: hypothetical protein [Flavobacteriaceae]|uniref:hypothetical protein n=1 Tax=Flavobacteriaceae TaxID=49546 RepID=UPI00234B165F|nr:hypothetical protein [Muricauda sp. SP22]MDC6361858.1 hypothetical protein [Muricauda sp. SP22]
MGFNKKSIKGQHIILVSSLIGLIGAFWGAKIEKNNAKDESRAETDILQKTITDLQKTIIDQNDALKEKQDSIVQLNNENKELIKDAAKKTHFLWSLSNEKEKTLIISECTFSFKLYGLSHEVQNNMKSLLGKMVNYTFIMYQEKDGKIVSEAEIDIIGVWESVFKDNGSFYKKNSFVYDLAQIGLRIFDSEINVISGVDSFDKALPLKFKPNITTFYGRRFDWENGSFSIGYKGKSRKAELENQKDRSFIGVFDISTL